jgi:2-octaprenyl-6-methoxyphenol hydroxylase
LRCIGEALIDVAIVGAGPVGATLAALLGREGRSTQVFEAKAGRSSDARTLALSQASVDRLDEIGGWPAAAATPIRSIHISQQGGPGRTLIDAADQGLPALGHTVPFSALEAALHASARAAGAEVHFGEACERIDLDDRAARVTLASGRTIEARLLVLADGGANAARIPGVSFTEKDYGQHAVVATVGADRPHAGRAWERFTPRGPMALLPVGERYALVWTATPEEARRAIEASPFDWTAVVDGGELLGWVDRGMLDGVRSVADAGPRRFSAYVTSSSSLREALDAIVTSRTRVAVVASEGQRYLGILTLERISREIVS